MVAKLYFIILNPIVKFENKKKLNTRTISINLPLYGPATNTFHPLELKTPSIDLFILPVKLFRL